MHMDIQSFSINMLQNVLVEVQCKPTFKPSRFPYCSQSRYHFCTNIVTNYFLQYPERSVLSVFQFRSKMFSPFVVAVQMATSGIPSYCILIRSGIILDLDVGFYTTQSKQNFYVKNMHLFLSKQR